MARKVLNIIGCKEGIYIPFSSVYDGVSIYAMVNRQKFQEK
jgi:hypothetical protein